MRKKEKKLLSREEILEKIRHYCAYQERSKLQVFRKLRMLGCAEDDIPAILEKLTGDRYLSENRFVEQYVRSRAVAKGWGPNKIAQALLRETGEHQRDKILLDADSSEKALLKLEKDLLRKSEELLRKQDLRIREKLCLFSLRRGFDAETSNKLVAAVLWKKDLPITD